MGAILPSEVAWSFQFTDEFHGEHRQLYSTPSTSTSSNTPLLSFHFRRTLPPELVLPLSPNVSFPFGTVSRLRLVPLPPHLVLETSASSRLLQQTETERQSPIFRRTRSTPQSSRRDSHHVAKDYTIDRDRCYLGECTLETYPVHFDRFDQFDHSTRLGSPSFRRCSFYPCRSSSYTRRSTSSEPPSSRFSRTETIRFTSFCQSLRSKRWRSRSRCSQSSQRAGITRQTEYWSR